MDSRTHEYVALAVEEAGDTPPTKNARAKHLQYWQREEQNPDAQRKNGAAIHKCLAMTILVIFLLHGAAMLGCNTKGINCMGDGACEGNTGLIGPGACNGDKACRYNTGNVSFGSCNGGGWTIPYA